MKQYFSLLGNGKFGQAIHHILKRNDDYIVRIFDISDNTNTLEYACFENCDLGTNKHWIIPAIPASSVVPMLSKIRFKSNCTVLLISKGSSEEGEFLPIELKNRWTEVSIATLAGPHFAQGIVDNQMTITSIGCNKQDKVLLEEIFDCINPVFTNDVLMVQILSVLKNFAAYVCGIGVGVGLTKNTQSALFGKCYQSAMDLNCQLHNNNDECCRSEGECKCKESGCRSGCKCKESECKCKKSEYRGENGCKESGDENRCKESEGECKCKCKESGCRSEYECKKNVHDRCEKSEYYRCSKSWQGMPAPIIADWMLCCTNSESRNFQAGYNVGRTWISDNSKNEITQNVRTSDNSQNESTDHDQRENTTVECLRSVESMYHRYPDNKLIKLVWECTRNARVELLYDFINN